MAPRSKGTAPDPSPAPEKSAETAETPRAEAYLGLARKYRPKNFGEMVGQEEVAQSLMNAVAGGRLVHGHLLAGPRGVGKTTSARILARCLNCEKGPTPTPCGVCTHCRAIAAGTDLDVIEFDAASHTQVEKMRELLENVVLSPFGSRFKVYVIDEVHMLSTSSFNALLKTLEEPPAHVVFVFATTEFEKIPETVRSRCSIHRFRRLTVEDIVRRLGEVAKAEKIELDEREGREVFGLIAQSADGGMRDALVAFDQLLAMTGGAPTVEAAERLLGLASHMAIADAVQWLGEGDAKSLLKLIDDLVNRGRSLERFVKGILSFLHEIMLLQADPKTDLVSISGQSLDRARDLANKLTQPAVFNLLNQMFELEERMKRSTHGRILVEFAFLRAASIKPIVPIGEVMDRLRALPDVQAESPGPSPRQTSGGAMRVASLTASERPTVYEAAAETATITMPRPAYGGSHMMGSAPRAAAALRENVEGLSAGEVSAGETGGGELAGLSRDEIINLLAPVLPDTAAFLGRYLRNAVSMRADEGALWIQWSKDDRVSPRPFAKTENRAVLEQALGQICGRPMAVKFLVSSEVTTAPAATVQSTAPSRPARPSGGPVMREGAAWDESDPGDEGSGEYAYEFQIPESYQPGRASAEVSKNKKDEDSGPAITEAAAKKVIEGNADFAKRARMVRDLLGGKFVDGAGRPIAI